MDNSFYFQFADDSVLNLSDPIESIIVEDKKIIICFLKKTGREDFFVDYQSVEEKKEDLSKLLEAWKISRENQPIGFSALDKRLENKAIQEELYFLQVGFGWMLLLVDINLVLTLLLIPSNVSRFLGLLLGVITFIYFVRLFIKKIR